MNLQLIEAIQSVSDRLASLAQKSTDRNTYLSTAAQAITDAVPSINGYQVQHSRQEADTGLLVAIFAQPYAALEFSLTEADASLPPLLRMWGTVVAATWQEYHQSHALHLIDQLDAIIGELWDASSDPNNILANVCRRIVDAMPNIDRVSILLDDHGANTGTIVAAFPTDTVGQVLRLDTYDLYQRLRTTKSPVVIEDTEQESTQLGPNQGILKAFAVQSILIIPLLVNGELIGSVGFDAMNQTHHFTEEEIRLLQSVVHQVALYMKRRQQLPATQVDASQQQLVEQVMQSIPLRSDIETLMLRTAEALGQALNASSVNIFLNNTIEDASQKQKAD